MARTSAIEAVFTTRPPSIYASPNFSAGSRRTPRWAARVVKRIAAGVPVPSPRVKVDPPAVVTRRFPVRTNLPNISRSNQSIGRFLHARPSPPYAADFRHGVAANVLHDSRVHLIASLRSLIQLIPNQANWAVQHDDQSRVDERVCPLLSLIDGLRSYRQLQHRGPLALA